VNTAPIPLVDLRAQHRQVADEVQRGFARVFDSTAFILGDEVAAFEQAYARWLGVAHCIGVGNGTDALELMLRALHLGPGDEVIVPVNSFIASALAVVRAGATPVFVDCDPTHLLIDVQRATEKIGPRTKAIMPVHLFGQMARMEELEAVALVKGVMLGEDAAQAHGATRHGKPAGGWGVAAGTSFYPGKNLGAYGDAGAVLTNSAEVAERVRALRNHGSQVKYSHPDTGFNSRLDTLQAVVLNAKLARLSEWNAARRAAAGRYAALLADCPAVLLPATLSGNEHVWHLYVVRVPRRDAVLERLHAAGIGAGIHYPLPIHLQGAFRQSGYQQGDFPIAEAAAAEVLSLPLFPEITAAQQERVVAELKRALR
jgi:dTDP-4-amino-4,6-dideoxygalactose transaminase